MIDFRTYRSICKLALESNGGIGLVPSPDSAEPTSSPGAPLTGLVQTLDMMVPTVTIRSPIEVIDDKNNPIRIQLKDGAKLYMSHDDFKRIKGDPPEVGKTLIAIMLRRPDDKSGQPSQVHHCEVR
jgi:hypothetical protein